MLAGTPAQEIGDGVADVVEGVAAHAADTGAVGAGALGELVRKRQHGDALVLTLE